MLCLSGWGEERGCGGKGGGGPASGRPRCVAVAANGRPHTHNGSISRARPTVKKQPASSSGGQPVFLPPRSVEKNKEALTQLPSSHSACLEAKFPPRFFPTPPPCGPAARPEPPPCWEASVGECLGRAAWRGAGAVRRARRAFLPSAPTGADVARRLALFLVALLPLLRACSPVRRRPPRLDGTYA